MSKPTLDFTALGSIFPSTSEYSQNYGWAAILSSTLLGFGQERLIPDLVDEILKQTGDDVMTQCAAFRKVREAVLKASALVGFPRVSVLFCFDACCVWHYSKSFLVLIVT